MEKEIFLARFSSSHSILAIDHIFPLSKPYPMLLFPDLTLFGAESLNIAEVLTFTASYVSPLSSAVVPWTHEKTKEK